MTINTNEMIPCVSQNYELDVMFLGKDQDFYNPLEDVTYNGHTGEIVLRGTCGEPWIIPSKKLSKYEMLDGTPIDPDKLPKDEWIRIRTRVSSSVTWMVQVPVSQTGEVKTERGDVLQCNRTGVDHGDGDWICCADDGGKPTLEWGCWVVNGVVQKRTYQPLK